MRYRVLAVIMWGAAALVLYAAGVLLIVTAFSMGGEEFIIPAAALSLALCWVGYLAVRAGMRQWRAGTTSR